VADKVEVGKSMFNATLICARAWKEVDLMMGELYERLQEQLGQAGLVKNIGGVTYVNKKDEETTDNDGWIYYRYAYKYSLTPNGPGRRSPFGWLTFEIVMADEDAPSFGIEESFVNILYDKEAWEINAFSLPPRSTIKYWAESDEVDDSYYRCSLEYERLWEFTWDEMEQPCWAFSVPLAALNSIDDLDNQIVTPVVELLRGEPAEKAMVKADKVMRFQGDCHECRRIIV